MTMPDMSLDDAEFFQQMYNQYAPDEMDRELSMWRSILDQTIVNGASYKEARVLADKFITDIWDKRVKHILATHVIGLNTNRMQ